MGLLLRRYDTASLDLSEIDWVIVGGESGPSHRAIKSEWVEDLRDQCLDSEVAFFFKQWGGSRAKQGGRLLDGRTWDNFPASQPRALLPVASSSG